jgi:hypothetical protein
MAVFLCFQFYHLASVRMQELCLHLSIKDMELKRKIWTCFEHSIIHHTDLMQDRHLDQILMCSVYVICKVSINLRCKVYRVLQGNGSKFKILFL